MGIALFTLSSLFAPLQAAAGRLTPAWTRSTRAAARRAPGPDVPPCRVTSRPLVAASATTASPRTPPRRNDIDRTPCRPPTLRVVRNIEAGIPVGSAGRMVISGRMADVCAELDRLTAIESTRKAAAR